MFISIIQKEDRFYAKGLHYPVFTDAPTIEELLDLLRVAVLLQTDEDPKALIVLNGDEIMVIDMEFPEDVYF